MFDTQLLFKASDPEFCVQAFAEYSARATERYSNLVAAMLEVVDSVVPDDERAMVHSSRAVSESDDVALLVQSIFEKYELRDSYIEGRVKAHDLRTMVTAYAKSIRSYVEGVSDTVVTTFEVPNLNAYTGEVITLADGTVETTIYTTTEFMDMLKANLHSVTCTAAASAAYAQETTADRLAVFENSLSKYFTDAKEDISSSAYLLKEKLSSSSGPYDFLSDLLQTSGIVDRAEVADVQSGETLDLSLNDFSAYTGATPAAALDFSAAQSVATKVVKTGAAILGGLATAIAKGVKSLWKKTKTYVTQVTTNPDDLQTINENGFGTVEGFYYDGKNENVYSEIPEEDIPWITTQDKVYIIEQRGRSWQPNWSVGSWVSYKLLSCEFCCRQDVGPATFRPTVQRLQLDDTHDRIYWRLDLANSRFLIKPRVFNPSKFLAALDHSKGQIGPLLDQLQALGPSLYNLTGLSEADKYLGLLYSNLLTVTIGDLCFEGFKRELDLNAHLILGYNAIPRTYTSPVTNLDWLNGFAGRQDEVHGLELPLPVQIPNPYPYSLTERTCMGFVSLIFASQLIEESRPTETAPFIPYSANHIAWNEPSHRICTDSENQARFTKFLTTAVVVAVVAVTAAAVMLKVKRLARNSYFKRLATVQQTNKKLASGQTLTASDQRRYLRAQRKLSASTILSKGLTAGTSTSSETTGIDADGIVRLIRG